MRIALLYSGMARTFVQCTRKTLALLEGLGATVDIYMSVWDTVGHSYKHWYEGEEKMRPLELLTDDQLNQARLERLIGHPIKKFQKLETALSQRMMDQAEAQAAADVRDLSSLRQIKSQYYQYQQVLGLVDEVAIYDWYVRIRPDVFIGRWPGSAYLRTPSATLFSSEFVWEDPTLKSRLGRMMNDCFWMSRSIKSMRTMAALFDELDARWSRESCAEQVMARFVQDKNLPAGFFDFDMHILRAHGFCQRMGTRRAGKSCSVPFSPARC